MNSRYKAFISYSHRDKQWATWLQNALERYRPPGRLRATDGTRFDRLRPIFRDNTELPSSGDLGSALIEAMRESAALVVICSPSAAASRWVNQEILTFRSLAPERPILCMLVDGSPEPGSDDCAFPPAILRDDQGASLPEPLAADVRKLADGKRGALLKIIAGLLGVGVDALRQRDQQHRVRLLSAVSAGTSLIAVVTIMLAVSAMQARDEADLRRSQAESLIDFMLVELRGKLEPIGRLDVLDAIGAQAMQYFSALGDLGSGEELLKRILALRQIGEVRFAEGRYDAALGAFDQSRGLARALVQRKPGDLTALFELSQAEFWVGYVDWQLGELAGAESAFQRYFEISELLLAREPDNPDYLLELTYALSNLAALARARGNAGAALGYIRQANTINLQLLTADPADDVLRSELAQGYSWEASILADRGELAASEQAFRSSLAEYETLHATGTDKRHSFSMTQTLGLLAVALLNQGELEASAAMLLRCVALAGELVVHDPANAQWQRLSVSCMTQLADVQRLRGLPEQSRQLLADLAPLMSEDPSMPAGAGATVDASVRSAFLLLSAQLSMDAGDTQVAHRLAREVLALNRQAGSQQRQLQAGVPVQDIQALILAGRAEYALGAKEAALSSWAEARALVVDAASLTPTARANLAQIEVLLGARQEADRLFAELESIGFRNPRYLWSALPAAGE